MDLFTGNHKEKACKSGTYALSRLFAAFLAVLIFMCLLPSLSHALIGIKEGDAPRTFTLQDLKGSTVNIGNYIGKKPVIIVFWELAMSASFIDYSLDELRFLNAFYEKHHEATGLEIFAVYTPEEEMSVSDRELEKVANLIKINNIKFPVLIDEGFRIFREYGVIALPSTVMVDKNGKIAFIYPSFPLAAQPLFSTRMKVLAGLAAEEERKEEEKAAGPDSHSVRLYNYSLQMFKKGLIEQAMSPLKKALEMDAAYPWSHNLMGIILWKKGDLRGSMEEFRQTVKLDKDNIPAHFNYGVLLFESEKYGDAEKQLKKVITLDGDMAEAHYVMGILCKKTDREDQAMDELSRALALFDNRKTSSVYEIYSPSAFHRISTLYELSGLYGKKGDSDRAMGLLQKAAEIALGLDSKAEKGQMHRSRDILIYE